VFGGDGHGAHELKIAPTPLLGDDACEHASGQPPFEAERRITVACREAHALGIGDLNAHGHRVARGDLGAQHPREAHTGRAKPDGHGHRNGPERVATGPAALEHG